MGEQTRKSSKTSAPANSTPLPPLPFSPSNAINAKSKTTSSPSNKMPPATPITASKASAKTAAAKSKIVTLKLSSSLLARFAPPETDATTTSARTKSDGSSSPIAPTPANNAAEQASVDAKGGDSNAASTPVVNGDGNGLLAPPPANAARRKGIPGPKPGMKRTASQLDVNGMPKPRGKPGPKKKPRLGENGEVIDGAAPAAPKLGPKANQGAINACLRALDRSGTPCRRWSKKTFNVKSFTGYQWGTDCFASFRKPESFPGDVKSDSSSAGDLKPTMDSSAVASQKSSSGDNAETPLPQHLVGITSSPGPAIVAA